MSEDSIGPYERGLAEFAARFEAVDPAALHAPLRIYLPPRPGVALDVGAGTGRDSAWLAGMGWEVFAVEPVAGFRSLGQRLHPDARIRWIDDALPAVDAVRRLGVLFDLIWLSAVWMHVVPDQRRIAFRRLATLLRPGGRLVVSLRFGSPDPLRSMYPVAVEEIQTLGLEHGLSIRAIVEQADALGRAEIHWKTVVLELPDDGTEALPVLRSIVLKDLKAATYKLALLRSLVRIADQSASLVNFAGEEAIVPLGLVALYWLRMFKPLVELDLPQAPRHRDGRGLGFVKAGFSQIRQIAPFELRPGAVFRGSDAHAVATALRDAAYTIARMPARFTTFPDGTPVFPTEYEGMGRVRRELVLNAETLAEFGCTRVPIHLWTAMRRLAAWIEPMILAEWTELVRKYGERQNRKIDGDMVRSLLGWIDPRRDAAVVRRIVSTLLDEGKAVYCVWTGSRIRDPHHVEIDHCFPWAAWPCDDLWNLMPSSRLANQSKRDRLVTRELLYSAADRIQDWWRRAYEKNENPALVTRFAIEARSTLPIAESIRSLEGEGRCDRLPALADLIDAMDIQRLRLRRDQQIPEWSGPAV